MLNRLRIAYPQYYITLTEIIVPEGMTVGYCFVDKKGGDGFEVPLYSTPINKSDIISCINRGVQKQSLLLHTASGLQWEDVKDQIQSVIVGKRNNDFNLYHEVFNKYEVVYYIQLDNDELFLTSEYMEKWNVSLAHIHNAALKNNKAELTSFHDLDSFIDLPIDIVDRYLPDMHILTNKNKYGSSAILSDNIIPLLKEHYPMGCEISPCTINEWLVYDPNNSRKSDVSFISSLFSGTKLTGEKLIFDGKCIR